MAQTFDSQSRTVGAILGPFERRPVVVPRFQRGFSWEKIHVTAFWNDMLAFSEEYEKAPKSASYFFGPIVVQNQTEEILLLEVSSVSQPRRYCSQSSETLHDRFSS
jgi:hypothetical protein